MKGRSAVIMSMGMLLEKVDTSGFIGKLLAKAAAEAQARKEQFAFTTDMRDKAFALSGRFNRAEIMETEFATDLLALLGIRDLSLDVFWQEWDAMLTIGTLTEKIKLLQSLASEHQVTVTLTSETNLVHVKKIAARCAEEKVVFSPEASSGLIGTLPLYTSCHAKKSRQDLLAHVIAGIRAQQFNQPSTIILLQGDPLNVADPRNRAVLEDEMKKTKAWCEENNVVLKLHRTDLTESFKNMFEQAELVEKPQMMMG